MYSGCLFAHQLMHSDFIIMQTHAHPSVSKQAHVQYTRRGRSRGGQERELVDQHAYVREEAEFKKNKIFVGFEFKQQLDKLFDIMCLNLNQKNRIQKNSSSNCCLNSNPKNNSSNWRPAARACPRASCASGPRLRTPRVGTLRIRSPFMWGLVVWDFALSNNMFFRFQSFPEFSKFPAL